MIGMLVDELKSSPGADPNSLNGLYEDTTIVFWTDHGE
jgi:arylsulfatase A-like enzyme